MAGPPWASRGPGGNQGPQRVVRPADGSVGGGAGAPPPSGPAPVRPKNPTSPASPGGSGGPAGQAGKAKPARASAVRRPGAGDPVHRVPRGAVAGTVRGPATMEPVRRRFSGPRILAGACLAAIIGAPILAAQGHGPVVQNWLLATEGYAAVLLIALAGIARRRGTVLGDMADSALVFVPRRSGGPPRRRPEYTTELHRFRVETILGETHACTLLGRLAGGHLNDGDFVHAFGRRTRSGELAATRVEVLSSANGVRVAGLASTRRTEFALARHADRLAVEATAVLAAGFVLGAVLVAR